MSAANGFAASITWGTPTIISGDGNVTNSGVALYAYAGTAATVNGVTFTAVSSGSTWGNVSFTSFGGFNAVFGATAAPFSTLTTAYSNVLTTAAWGSGTSGIVTLNGLTSGHAYTVQVWVNDSRGGYQSRYETVTSSGGNTATLYFAPNSNSAGAVGQYVVGTFTASGTSQAFTINGNSVVQVNAISVRDTGVYVFTPTPFTATRVNLAKYQPVITDSTTGTQVGRFITDGLTFNDSYWQSGASGTHWAQVAFPFPVPVGSVQLVMGRDTVPPPTVFWMQYLTNGAWVTVPGTTVVNNTNKERNLVFTSPITASSFRFYDSIDGNIYIREMALYPPNGTNGYPVGTDFGVDLARKQPVFDIAHSAGNYPKLAVDGLVNSNSAWQTTLIGSNSLLINLQFTNKIGSAHLYSGATGVAPLTNYLLQYWDGAAWQNIPGGSVSGNSSGTNVITFTTPVTTTKVQLLFTNSGTSAVQELCIFSANSNGGYPVGTGVNTNPPITAQYNDYADSYYYLSNAVAGQMVVESNGVPVLGTVPAYTWANRVAGWPGQYQLVLSFENGTYRLINHNTGLCLAGAQLTTNVGAQLVDEDYNALPDQEWYLQSVDGVNFYLVNRFSGLVMDTQGGTLVQNVQTNSTSQYWQFPLAAGFPKKGSGGPSLVSIQNASWSYTWGLGTGTPLPTNNVYYTMFEKLYGSFGNNFQANCVNLCNQLGWRTNGYSQFLLGYNEPDSGLAGNPYNFDATNGAIAWYDFNSCDMALAAPSATGYNTAFAPDTIPWMRIFMGYVVTNWGLRVDAVPIHQYLSPLGGNSDCWVNPCQDAHNIWGKPVWMTEFGCIDWGGNQSWSEEDCYTALAEFMWRAESLPWLSKYALFGGPPGGALAPNPWTRYTPAPSGNSYDTNGVIAPFGDLFAAWDGDANVETNKAYYVYNSSTRKNLANTPAPQFPDAKTIDVRDSSTQWTLQLSPTNGQYYLVSVADGRRLSYNGTTITLVAASTTGTAVQWSLTSYRYGWYYLDHPATGKRLQLAYNNSTFVATYTMVATTTTSTAVQWRFIVPYTPNLCVWTGGSNTVWYAAPNWNSSTVNPTVNRYGNYAIVFNSLSTSNLNTVMNVNSAVYSLVVSNPAGPVSIGATTNLLAITSGIDLANASQNLTINAPVFFGVSQGGAGARHFWTVAGGRTLSLNGRVDGFADLIIAGGGTVSLGGTNTYTGSTTINAGMLTISGAGQLGGGNYASAITDNGVFNYNSSTDQTLSGNISGTGSVTVSGLGNLTLAGTNTYTGNTTINSGGTLALGSSLASTNITLAGGAMFDVSGLTTPFTLGSGRTLANNSVGAVISGTNNCTLGTLSLVTDGVNPSFIQTNGTMTISASTIIKVNNTGGILGVGNHPLIAAATTGNAGLVTGALPLVVVTGNGVGGSTSLQIDGAGNLNLVVTSTTATNPMSINFTFSSSALTLTWPADHLGWIAQSNSLSLANSNYWFDILGSQAATNLVIPINPTAPTVFYRLRYPF